ncbi:hypothetical protein A9Q99_21580 [Gammaproteobacteria bacterium 45_16_T64]|nr:hypothetical protein A9Q99_21580 [Gammaproteobacteria bacterium 45_16_T64]
MNGSQQSFDKLVFVYNADSGLVNLAKDILHKLLSPSTYPCSLCDLTYSVFGEKQSWVRFRKQLNVAQEYLHIDEFTAQYENTRHWGSGLSTVAYPAIFTLESNGMRHAVSKEELDACESLPALKSLVLSLLE